MGQRKPIPLTQVSVPCSCDTDMLIGMDIISMCDFSLTSTNDQTKFSFQIPSSLDIDFTLM